MCECVRGKFRISVFKAGVKYSHDSALNSKHSKQNAKLFSNISGMISDLELFALKVQKNRPPASSYTQEGNTLWRRIKMEMCCLWRTIRQSEGYLRICESIKLWYIDYNLLCRYLKIELIDLLYSIGYNTDLTTKGCTIRHISVNIYKYKITIII